MRICVFGAGAIGGHFAARLAQGGAEVSVIARGAQLAAIEANGLHVHAPDGVLASHPVATDDPRRLGPQDAVIVTTKATALGTVAQIIAPLLGPETPVVFALNGVPWWYFDAHGGPFDGRRLPRLDPGDTMRSAIGMDRTLGCVILTAGAVLSPGNIQVATKTNSITLGEPDGRLTQRLDAIAAPFRAGGLPVKITPRIREDIWSKLLRNLAVGPLGLLTQSAPKAYCTEAACTTTIRTVFAEAGAVAAAYGCPVDIDVEEQLGLIRDLDHRSSILQDLERNRPMEIDAVFDAPLQLARLAGVATPTLDLLVALVKARARTASLYGP